MYQRREAVLQQHLAEIEAELVEVRHRRGSAEQLYKAEFGGPFVTDDVFDQPQSALMQPPGHLTGASWGDAIIRVLDEHGPALHIKEIWRLLEEGGFRTEARDPLRSIVAIALRLDPAVIRVAPNTYALSNGRPAAGAKAQLQVGGERG
jgi:hypothetical protein